MKEVTFDKYFGIYVAALIKSVWPTETKWDFLPQGWQQYPQTYAGKILKIQQESGLLSGNPAKGSPMLSPFALLNKPELKKAQIPDFFVSSQPVPQKPGEGDITYLFPNESKSSANVLSDLKESLKEFQPSNYHSEGKPDFHLMADALLSLLHVYLGTFPLDNTGITVYEYARLIAAAAVSTAINEDNDQPGDGLLFVKADISGIQDYIFDVVSDGAAKSLKARSFRVQALSLMAVDYLMRTWGLSPANVLYNGGGVFVMLLPECLKGELSKIQKEIAKGILETQDHTIDQRSEAYLHVPESLTVYMGAVPVKVRDLGQDFGKFWREVEAELNKQRLCFYDNIGRDLIFTPLEAVNQTSRREAERDFFKGKVKRKVSRKEKGDYTGFNWYEGCIYEQINQWGANATLSAKKINEGKTIVIPDPYSAFKRSVVFAEKESVPDVHTRFNSPGNFSGNLLPHPQPFTYLVKDLPLWDKPLKKAFKDEWQKYKETGDPYMEADDLKPRVDRIIQFGHLAMFANQRTGTEKIAILKMDVDNLGKIFQSSLKPERATLAHTAYLSRSLKWFFEGYMNHLLLQPLEDGINKVNNDSPDNYLNCYLEKIVKKDGAILDNKSNDQKAFRKQGVQRFLDNLYVVYSGGDDVLMVGAWDVVMEFAAIVQEEFDRFTKGQVSISAGIILVSPKFPVSRFADLVEEAEQKAKAVVGKNRICVFDQVITWEEYRLARKLRNTLYYLVSKEVDPEPKALIQKIRKSMVGFEKIQQMIEARKSINLPKLWRLNYFLRSRKEANQAIIKEDVVNYYEDLFKKTLSRNKTHNPALIAVAARWAEFMCRNID